MGRLLTRLAMRVDRLTPSQAQLRLERGAIAHRPVQWLTEGRPLYVDAENVPGAT